MDDASDDAALQSDQSDPEVGSSDEDLRGNSGAGTSDTDDAQTADDLVLDDPAESGHDLPSIARGRDATSPLEIPSKGWKDIVVRIWHEISKDNLSIVAAGVAFYAFLALFPALAAILSVYGLFTDTVTVETQIAQLFQVLPPSAANLVGEQMRDIAADSGTSLGFTALFGIFAAIWSANKGMRALIRALNIAYDEKETRGWVRLTLFSMMMTFGAVSLMIVVLGIIVALPLLFDALNLEGQLRGTVELIRWPIVGGVLLASLDILYRYAPNRERPAWRWVTWGSAAATVLWLAASFAFSYYVANFGSYNETYGSVGAVAVLLLWFWLSAYTVLLGAELNSEMEHQTFRDTTAATHDDADQMGERGARVADSVGETAS